MSFTDDQLVAYFEGSLPEAEAAALEAAIETDAGLEARLMALDPLAAPVRAAFEQVPGSERLEGLIADLEVAPEPAPASRRGFLAAGIAILVSAAAGFVVSDMVRPEAAIGWRDQVALYQALYTPETVAHLDASPEVLAAQFARASAALGREVSPEQVTGLPGLELRRAQVLAFNDVPLVQVVFAGPEGQPVAFCIIGLTAGTTEAAVFDTMAGLPTSVWGRDGFGFMLLGDLERSEIEAVTTGLRAVF